MPLRAKVLSTGLVLGLTLGAAAPADASRKPTRSEARAIKKAFFKNHPKADTKIRRIRVSTVDRRFAAVAFRTEADTVSARAAVVRKLPPELLKRKGGKFKPVLPSKAPKKVTKELKVKNPTSLIRISGDVNATLTRGASCTPGEGTANIYDPGSDLLLSIQFFDDTYSGPGRYPALGVRSLAGLYVNQGTELRWQTGQSTDAFQPSGDIYAGGTWGVIEATMARIGTEENEPQSVTISGSWACR